MIWYEDRNTLNIEIINLNQLDDVRTLRHHIGMMVVDFFKIALSQGSEVYDLYKCLGYSWVPSPAGG